MGKPRRAFDTPRVLNGTHFQVTPKTITIFKLSMDRTEPGEVTSFILNRRGGFEDIEPVAELVEQMIAADMSKPQGINHIELSNRTLLAMMAEGAIGDDFLLDPWENSDSILTQIVLCGQYFFVEIFDEAEQDYHFATFDNEDCIISQYERNYSDEEDNDSLIQVPQSDRIN